jgi:RHS repeat-associated protein
MKKIFILLVLLAGMVIRAFAQMPGSSMSSPIGAGNYNSSGTYADSKSNVAGNGFTNNYGQSSNDVWYSFSIGSANSNTVSISLCGSNFDTYLHVLNSSGTEIGTNDDNGPLCSGTQSSLSLSNLAPGTYYVDAEGYSTSTGTIAFSLNVNIVMPLAISYMGPQTYLTGAVITALSPAVTGGTVSPAGQTSTFAGTGSAGSTNGTGTSASFNQPLGATVDPLGNIYVAEGISHLIRKITPAGVVTTFAGSGSQGFMNGTGTGASFYHPAGLASDASGNIYVADEDNNMIRKISPAGVVTTFAGSGAQGSADGAAGSASFYFPCGVAVDGSGNVYVADAFNNKIRKITAAGVVSTLAGNGTAGTADGTGTGATFSQPFSVVTDASGNIYVTDRVGAKIRKVTPAGVVTTLAGNGTAGYQDGTTAGTTQFNAPTGLGIDKSGNLYVADEANNRIRKVTPGGVVTTLSGTGAQGSINGAGTVSTFYLPFALTADAGGLVYVGDYTTNLIRKIVATPYTVSPALPAGLTLNITTGVISGTPTTATAQAAYSITANNNYNTTSASLVITVINGNALYLSADQNYVATYIPRENGLTTDAQVIAASSDKNNEQVQIQYLDGLGRNLQTVQARGSFTGHDVVQPFDYDQFGREIKKYLPYSAVTGLSNGSYKPDALTAGSGLAQYYASPPTGVTATTDPYSQARYESSPLNRVTEQGAPGADWQPAAAHTQKVIVRTNNGVPLSDTTNTVIAAVYRTTINADQSQTLIQNGYYTAGQLTVTVTKDENWKSTSGGNSRGGTTEEFKNMDGQVILRRSFYYTSGTLQILSTYYVYDDLGNLAFVLPPGTTPDAPGTPQYLNTLGYQYRYDERNRLTQKKLPGKDWEYMVYNNQDLLVLDQDGNQRPGNQWKVTKYDATGRTIMTGLWNAGAVIPLTTLQNSIYTNSPWDTRDITNNTTSNPTGYVLKSYPSMSQILTVNYYDSYDNIPAMPVRYKLTSGISTMTKGLMTASKNAVLNTLGNASPDYLWKVLYYDDKANGSQAIQQHYVGGTVNENNFDVTITKYNFNNQVSNTNRKHFTTADLVNPKLTINNKYIYDHSGRRIKNWEQLTNGANAPNLNDWTLISQQDYNEIGQLTGKHLHATYTDSTHFKQDIALRYNERGWLLSSSAPLFTEQLFYNTGVTPQYNGNISGQQWSVSGAANKTYAYQYDQMNRLVSGNSPNGNNENNISFDLMGNITKLNRYTGGVLTDQLAYTYVTGTNTLLNVIDNSGSNIGQKNGTTNYSFDTNGNLASDDGKGITAISYNLLNLPQGIAGKSTTYTYDAAGQKLARLIGTAKTDYLGSIQYDGTVSSSTISFIQTEEGRALSNGASYNYEYTLTDHLGNSRVSFDSFASSVTAKQVNEYFPLGLNIDVLANGTKNEYLYNRKELQENLGLYDYGARFYDPVVGRWTSVDPLAEKNRRWTPYNYTLNNPLRFIDPDGMSEETFTDQASIKKMLTYLKSLKQDEADDDGDLPPDWVMDDKTKKVHNDPNVHDASDVKEGETYVGKTGNYTSVEDYRVNLWADGTWDMNMNKSSDNYVQSGAGDVSTMFSSGLFLTSNIFSLINENSLRNIKAIKTANSWWKNATGKYPKSAAKALESEEFTSAVTEAIGKRLFFVGVIFSATSIIKDHSVENVLVNVSDNLVGAAGIWIPGVQPFAIAYFTGRFIYDTVQAYRNQQ